MVLDEKGTVLDVRHKETRGIRDIPFDPRRVRVHITKMFDLEKSPVKKTDLTSG